MLIISSLWSYPQVLITMSFLSCFGNDFAVLQECQPTVNNRFVNNFVDNILLPVSKKSSYPRKC